MSSELKERHSSREIEHFCRIESTTIFLSSLFHIAHPEPLYNLPDFSLQGLTSDA